jgi:hypothetical protein
MAAGRTMTTICRSNVHSVKYLAILLKNIYSGQIGRIATFILLNTYFEHFLTFVKETEDSDDPLARTRTGIDFPNEVRNLSWQGLSYPLIS